jgi:RNA polymerase sigma factor (TIGR02999 family)
MTEPGDITRLLQRIASGDASAEPELMPHVYSELRRIAQQHMRRESGTHTLQATALVHEAYLRLAQGSAANYQNRAHFFAISSRVMRRILIENARHRGRDKRGAGVAHVALDENVLIGPESDEIVLAVHEALDRLESLDPQQARIVEMRFFSGLEVAEIAEVLKLSVRSVHREWSTARAWLYGELRSKS